MTPAQINKALRQHTAALISIQAHLDAQTAMIHLCSALLEKVLHKQGFTQKQVERIYEKAAVEGAKVARRIADKSRGSRPPTPPTDGHSGGGAVG